jgi:DNA-binding response OmpR family regulator
VPTILVVVVVVVVVVDDDDAVRGLVADVLSIEGYVVSLAADGFAALRMIQSDQPDAVILDVMVPGLDGHDVLARIRRSERGADLPVIMLTAA